MPYRREEPKGLTTGTWCGRPRKRTGNLANAFNIILLTYERANIPQQPQYRQWGQKLARQMKHRAARSNRLANPMAATPPPNLLDTLEDLGKLIPQSLGRVDHTTGTHNPEKIPSQAVHTHFQSASLSLGSCGRRGIPRNSSQLSGIRARFGKVPEALTPEHRVTCACWEPAGSRLQCLGGYDGWVG